MNTSFIEVTKNLRSLDDGDRRQLKTSNRGEGKRELALVNLITLFRLKRVRGKIVSDLRWPKDNHTLQMWCQAHRN